MVDKSTARRLTMEARGDGFVLCVTESDGSSSELLLTDEDVLSLAQSAPLMALPVLAKQHAGANPVAAFEVQAVALNTDHHHSEVHLQLQNKNGHTLIVALPLPVADALAVRLPSFLREMAAFRAAQRSQ